MISTSAIKCLRPRVKHTPVLVSYLPFVFVLLPDANVWRGWAALCKFITDGNVTLSGRIPVHVLKRLILGCQYPHNVQVHVDTTEGLLLVSEYDSQAEIMRGIRRRQLVFFNFELESRSDPFNWVDIGTPLYGRYKYVRPQRVWFFGRFSHELGIDFSHFATINRVRKIADFGHK